MVRDVLAGDRRAFGVLYDRYAPLVRSVCYDVTGRLPEAADLAQEVFLRAFRKLGGLRDPDRFAAWLVGIARCVGREWRRARAHDRHRFLALPPDVAAADTPADDVAEQLRGLIRRLPERERLALHSFYLQDQSADEARHVLGLSVAGFYKLLDRARRRPAHPGANPCRAACGRPLPPIDENQRGTHNIISASNSGWHALMVRKGVVGVF